MDSEYINDQVAFAQAKKYHSKSEACYMGTVAAVALGTIHIGLIGYFAGYLLYKRGKKLQNLAKQTFPLFDEYLKRERSIQDIKYKVVPPNSSDKNLEFIIPTLLD